MKMNEEEYRISLAELIRWMNSKGWSPGTSTNYSLLHPEDSSRIVISKSGIDKTFFAATDFLEIDRNGQPTTEFEGIKPSAETLIHCELYELFPETKFILHSHSLASTVLSDLSLNTGELVFSGYEVLKGLPNCNTHETSVSLPIFPNDQDMNRFRLVIRENQSKLLKNGFLMAKHGLYTWGTSLAEAKRHLEIYEFLLACELTLLQIKK